MKVRNKIPFALLAWFYLAMVTVVSVSAIGESLPCSGANQVDATGGASSETPQKYSEQGRHVPLAKVIPSPAPHVADVVVPSIADEQRVVISVVVVAPLSVFLTAPISGRAPPLA